MSHQKVVYECAERDAAHTAAGLLEELFVPTPDAVTVFEVANGAGSTDAKTWRIEAYFNATGDTGCLLKNMASCLNVPADRLALEPIPNENWVALSQAALPPVYAGRFTIYGSHDRDRVARGPNAILIDAGEAFGTAHHATTYGCLLALDRLTRAQPVYNALDLGCGSAVLSIALARVKPHARIMASDVDQRSVQVAAENVYRNGIQRSITTLSAPGFNHPALRVPAQFDLIIANILAGPLVGLAPDVARATEIGGTLILSGILKEQAHHVQARYLAHGFHVCSKIELHGWTTLTLKCTR